MRLRASTRSWENGRRHGKADRLMRKRSWPVALLACSAIALVAAQPAPDGTVLDKHVETTMRDGVVLRADVYRPSAPGRYPVLLQRTPYSKHAENADNAFRAFARLGFAVIVQDTRGRYMSDG